MTRFLSALILACAIAMLATGCASSDPKPPKPRISSMPQNLPQSWEGQSRMGGMPMSY
ncbi:MAG: hypothetical protein KDM63_04350 [Verrucomicrobiae bacterium]|nr:hypothetical protein [Verrucomicrobiae bacterium]MCB1086252.1 hypothetical protein [Verrucomicrobiae bacterium]MCB1090577.1 hypothetical protein [Verrucomicrobiae bacterium]